MSTVTFEEKVHTAPNATEAKRLLLNEREMLRLRILQAVDDFTNNTGLSVTSISIEHELTPTGDVVVDCKVETKL